MDSKVVSQLVRLMAKLAWQRWFVGEFLIRMLEEASLK